MPRFRARSASAPRPPCGALDRRPAHQFVTSFSPWSPIAHDAGRAAPAPASGNTNHVCERSFGTDRTGGARADTHGWAAIDALAEVPPGGQGRGTPPPVHRADGDHRAGVRLLGYPLESLRQVDAARRRETRGDLGHRVLLPDAPA